MAARTNSSWAPRGPRSRSRPSFRMRFKCANRISIFLRSRCDCSKPSNARLALRGLLLGSVGNDDAACGLLFGVDALDHDAVVERAKFHAILLGFFDYFWIGSRNERVPATLISPCHWDTRASAREVCDYEFLEEDRFRRLLAD